MSKHIRTVPSVFLHYHGLTLPQRALDRTQLVEGGRQKLQQKGDASCELQASSALLRDDHIVLLAIDTLLSLHRAFNKWRNRRRTLRALADLDERQLRDIGLAREGLGYHSKYRALAELDDTSTLDLKDRGVPVRRKPRQAPQHHFVD